MCAESSAGNTRGLIEASTTSELRRVEDNRSSAGNTRGLIEAGAAGASQTPPLPSLPRGIPAASLKRILPLPGRWRRGRLPRGIPAASLKLRHVRHDLQRLQRLPRGIPAASLKPVVCVHSFEELDGLPRGIPAASLKRVAQLAGRHGRRGSSAGNTRGLIEAPLKRLENLVAFESSAGNTRGLIEAHRRTRRSAAGW